MKIRKILLPFCFLLGIVAPRVLNAQSTFTFPDTPVGKMAELFFEAFNAPDRERMEEFITDKRTSNALKRIAPEKRMKMYDRQKKIIVNLTPFSLLEADTLHLELMAYAPEKDAWFKIGFGLEEGSELLESLLLRPGKAPKNGTTDAVFGEWKKISQLLENAINKKQIPGIAMVTISNGRINQAGVAGVIETGSTQRIGKNSRFHLGSLTKSMTATLIGKLIEEKKIAFETTLSEVFPELDMVPQYKTVTIRELLDHRAGIPGYLSPSEEEEAKLLALPGSPKKQRSQFVAQVLMETPAEAPGVFAYSNAGYTILGSICEQITDQSWEELLEDDIFLPLNMKTAGTGWPRQVGIDEPRGHFGYPDSTHVQDKAYKLGPYLAPAGEVHSSVKDLAKFLMAHMRGLNGKDNLLTADTYQELHTSKEGYYAGGWIIRKSENGMIIHEHLGSAGSFLAYMGMVPETETGWVIAVNVGDPFLQSLMYELIEEVSPGAWAP